MVGLVVATHGRLAEELIRTAERIVGPIERIAPVSVDAQSSMDDARARLAAAIEAVDQGQGVLVLTDMFGGSPANLALTFLADRIEVVTGVNLPMLLKLAGSRGDQLAAAAELAVAQGQKNVQVASALLRGRAQAGGHGP